MDVLTVVIASLATSIIFAAGTSRLGAIFGLESANVGIGLGPRLTSAKLGSMRLEIRPVPIGSFVKFRDPVFGDEYNGINPVFRLSALKASLVMVGPPLILVALAIATLLGTPARAARLGSLVALWTGVSCLLPIPSQNGFALLQRLRMPASKLPEVQGLSSRLKGCSLLALMAAGLLAFVTLCFNADFALGILERVVPSTPPN